MKRKQFLKQIAPLTLILIFMIGSFATIGAASFDLLKTKNSDNKTVTFPTEFLSEGNSIFAFVLSSSREGGESQQKHLLDWQEQLTEHPNFPSSVSIYHLPVIENPPGFVKGFIRKGLGKTYKEYVEDDKVAVLFVKDAEKFALQANLAFEEEAVVAVVDKEGNVIGFVQGEVSSSKIEKLLALLIE